MNRVLIVVDMQNDFVNGTLGTKEAVNIVPNELTTVFENGEFVKRYTLNEVRQNLHGGNF